MNSMPEDFLDTTANDSKRPDACRVATGVLTGRQLDELIRDPSVPLGLSPGEPDFVIHLHAENGRYFLHCCDAGARLKWRVTSRTPLVPEHAGLLYGAQQALASIDEATIGSRLCQRYGFSTRRAARQSLRKLRVAIHVTDGDLAELGQSLSDAEDPRTLLDFMDEPDARRYGRLVQQIRRFDTIWHAITPEHGLVDEVRRWATPLLLQVEHDGEVRSRSLKIAVVPSIVSAAISPAA